MEFSKISCLTLTLTAKITNNCYGMCMMGQEQSALLTQNCHGNAHREVDQEVNQKGPFHFKHHLLLSFDVMFYCSLVIIPIFHRDRNLTVFQCMSNPFDPILSLVRVGIGAFFGNNDQTSLNQDQCPKSNKASFQGKVCVHGNWWAFVGKRNFFSIWMGVIEVCQSLPRNRCFV